MTDWIFEYVYFKFNSEKVNHLIASDRKEALCILSEMGVVWSELYALKPVPPLEEKEITE